MATILTHPVVPLTCSLLLVSVGAKHISLRLILLGMLCSVLPDLDVLTFKLGIDYASAFGHRGFSHSLLFAILIATGASFFHKKLNSTSLAVWLLVAFATASHGILDAMTTGGLGVEFWWPISEQRFFLPWQFIKVSPIGVRFFSERGWLVLQSELLTVWLPCGLLLLTVKAATYFLLPTKSP